MPEGDTVWRHARQLHRALAGDPLTGSDFRVPALATADFAGRTVTEVVSRGKHLLLRTDGARSLTLHSHLRMDGIWRLFRPGEPWRGRPAHQIRVALSTARVSAVGFHLHDLALVPTAEEATLVGHLGPDLLGPDWDPAEAVRRLADHPEREIATALLDQRNLAGIGNLYKCELLFLRGISPWAPVAQAGDLDALVGLAYRLLVANRDRWTQATTGSLRRGETTWVYGRARRPCRRCGTLVRQHRSDRTSEDRVTFWCPTCQPGPAPG
ncbi:MAG: DNA-formamidopyrimidine glycosylase family protein [Micromonosporaceae bacterium]